MTNDFIDQLDAQGRELASSLPMSRVVRRLLAGNITWTAYVVGFLCQTYHYTSKSSVWLEQNARRLAEQERYPELAAHLERKAHEERGHDLWALSDATALGAPPDIMTRTSPSNAVRAYVEYNDLITQIGSPLGILGTSYPLEYIAAYSAGGVVQNLIVRSSIAGIERGVTFLKGHAAADVHHVAELREALERVVDPEDQQAILRAARTTTALFPLFFTLAGSSFQR